MLKGEKFDAFTLMITSTTARKNVNDMCNNFFIFGCKNNTVFIKYASFCLLFNVI